MFPFNAEKGTYSMHTRLEIKITSVYWTVYPFNWFLINASTCTSTLKVNAWSFPSWKTQRSLLFKKLLEWDFRLFKASERELFNSKDFNVITLCMGSNDLASVSDWAYHLDALKNSISSAFDLNFFWYIETMYWLTNLINFRLRRRLSATLLWIVSLSV